MKTLLNAALLVLLELNASACMWDSDTLSQELTNSPNLAGAILGNVTPVDPAPLRERITRLKADRHENDSAWWNDLAGAHIRLGETKEAVAILEPLLEKFPNDYGIHANLGTAYHLLGRYADAEKEIARDLEINPDGHFGREKYHLALLQYLNRDAVYQKSHVYVDEFSEAALREHWGNLGLMDRFAFGRDELRFLEAKASGATNDFPAYRWKWDLGGDTNLQSGVIDMATFNPREPACSVMLGVACLATPGNRDLNLAKAAFQKAIDLGSPQTEVLRERIAMINEHIAQATGHGPIRYKTLLPIALFLLIPAALGVCLISMIRARRKSIRTPD
jgi:tetratricopeptide (TPR) repeat protein